MAAPDEADESAAAAAAAARASSSPPAGARRRLRGGEIRERKGRLHVGSLAESGSESEAEQTRRDELLFRERGRERLARGRNRKEWKFEALSPFSKRSLSLCFCSRERERERKGRFTTTPNSPRLCSDPVSRGAYRHSPRSCEKDGTIGRDASRERERESERQRERPLDDCWLGASWRRPVPPSSFAPSQFSLTRPTHPAHSLSAPTPPRNRQTTLLI